MRAVRLWALALALALSGCLPMAMLKPPEPVRGTELALGGR
ncbi:hypothetical protein [Thermus sp.]